jgi:hypothetical protein
VDIDPVMLAIGRGAIGTVDGRLRWIQADLASPDWLEELGETQVDAVLSTTALRWLPPQSLAHLYRDALALTVIGYLASLQAAKLAYRRLPGRWL